MWLPVRFNVEIRPVLSQRPLQAPGVLLTQCKGGFNEQVEGILKYYVFQSVYEKQRFVAVQVLSCLYFSN